MSKIIEFPENKGLNPVLAEHAAASPKSATSWRDTLKIHPAADLLPLMSADKLRELGEDIVKNGLKLPIVRWLAHPKGEAVLLDGRNRLDAIELVTGQKVEVGAPSIMAGDDFLACDKVIELDGRVVDPWAYVISVNILRRDLTPEERQNALIRLIARTPEKSDRQFAEEIGVDHKTVGSARARGEATGEVSPVEKRVGRDGKSRRKRAPKAPPDAPEAAIPDDAELIAALNAAPHWSDAAWTRVLEQLPFERFMRVKPPSYGPKLARLATQYSDPQARHLELVH